MKAGKQPRSFRSIKGVGNGTGRKVHGHGTPPPPTLRCDEILVSLVIREYNTQGVVIGERVTQPTKIFRTTTDLWAAIDADLAREREVIRKVGTATPPPPAPPAAKDAPLPAL